MDRTRELGSMLDSIADNVVELYPQERDALRDASRLLVSAATKAEERA